MAMAPDRRKKVIEMVLLCSQEPVDAGLLRSVLGADGSSPPGEREVRESIAELRRDWEDRALELAETAGGWQFRTRPEFREHAVAALREKPPRMTRALLEVLAVIAYHQPATRGDIERIRGVSVFPNHIRQLEDHGWIRPVGHRETPGRPMMYGTTQAFLDDLGMVSLGDLPPLEEGTSIDALLEEGADAADKPDGEGDIPPAGEEGEAGQEADGDAPPAAGNGAADRPL